MYGSKCYRVDSSSVGAYRFDRMQQVQFVLIPVGVANQVGNGLLRPPYWGSMVSVVGIGVLSWSLELLRRVCDRCEQYYIAMCRLRGNFR